MRDDTRDPNGARERSWDDVSYESTPDEIDHEYQQIRRAGFSDLEAREILWEMGIS